MNAKQFELALKKQRLQLQSDQLREQWHAHAQGLAPMFGIADQARVGVTWVRRHPVALVGVGVAVAVAKPKVFWRWAKRALLAWQMMKKMS
jgi:hypothetical protein